MAFLDMTDHEEREIPDTRIYEKSRWVRAGLRQGGFFFPTAELGDIVQVGDVLGTVVDPLTDEIHEVVSPIPGEIIGMAVPQPVLSGYALFHIGWHDTD
jgi:predicted deacylase